MAKGMTDLAGVRADEAQMPWEDRVPHNDLSECLRATAEAWRSRPALSFQLTSDPKDKGETLSWAGLYGQVSQFANFLRGHGVHEGDVVAMLLPNCNEAVVAHLGAMTAGISFPINPTLAPEHIAALLRETGARVVVTLAPFPRTDLSDHVARAIKEAPNVEMVLEVDLAHYLPLIKRTLVSLLRPRRKVTHNARTIGFATAFEGQSPELSFAPQGGRTRIGAYFHTGGTTGAPKIVQHSQEGLLYNMWVGQHVLASETDVLLCPLPMFHVFGANVVLLAALGSGAHLVMPTPQGYRGDGVFDNFWKLIEKWRATFIVTVPTAAAALMQRKVNADVSSLVFAFSGSAALPRELFRRFEETTGVRILEGYGMTETTCLISGNPLQGERKIGSVGLNFPYTDVRIRAFAEDGTARDCAVEEVGEICVSNPGVLVGQTYTSAARNADLFTDTNWLRTGDLGRRDAEGYIYITGRAKDIIIRGGHNIDPALIEEALLSHPAVAFAGAIGQPDAHAGEVPCVYVELVEGADVTTEALLALCREQVPERAAIPKYIELMDALPKTAVGKIFKPDLRKQAIRRVFNDTLAKAGCDATVCDVVDDKALGLVALLDGKADTATVATALQDFAGPWRWKDEGAAVRH